MRELAVVVEGETERAFARGLLAPALGNCVCVWAIIGGKLGSRQWARIQADIVHVFRQSGSSQRIRICTTMFDYYGLPNDWPGLDASVSAPRERVQRIETEMARRVCAKLGEQFPPARFVPYIQLHEFEALLFADTGVLAEVAAGGTGCSAAGHTTQFEDAVTRAGGDPELIDKGFETCPSRRILRAAPWFVKTVDGINVARRIGIEAISGRCAHFADWIQRIKSAVQS